MARAALAVRLGMSELARFYERADLVFLLRALGDGDSELPAQRHKAFPGENTKNAPL